MLLSLIFPRKIQFECIFPHSVSNESLTLYVDFLNLYFNRIIYCQLNSPVKTLHLSNQLQFPIRRQQFILPNNKTH